MYLNCRHNNRKNKIKKKVENFEDNRSHKLLPKLIVQKKKIHVLCMPSSLGRDRLNVIKRPSKTG